MLATGGPDAVRVEALAKRLGVTKGGFYGYFADRDALLEAMLDAWERESVDEVLDRVEEAGGDPKAKARRDEAVAARLRRVDNRRMGLLREMIGTFCSDPGEVEARSLIAFCVAIGHHSLAADHEGRTRAEVLDRAAALVLDSSS